MIVRFIELDNGIKFCVITELDFEANHYLYVASVTKDVKYFFLKKQEEKVEFVEDGELILNLLNMVTDFIGELDNKQLKK